MKRNCYYFDTPNQVNDLTGEETLFTEYEPMIQIVDRHTVNLNSILKQSFEIEAKVCLFISGSQPYSYIHLDLKDDVEKLVKEENGNVNAIDSSGNSALLLALENGNFRMKKNQKT